MFGNFSASVGKVESKKNVKYIDNRCRSIENPRFGIGA
jgi:hypothetical protein